MSDERDEGDLMEAREERDALREQVRQLASDVSDREHDVVAKLKAQLAEALRDAVVYKGGLDAVKRELDQTQRVLGGECSALRSQLEEARKMLDKASAELKRKSLDSGADKFAMEQYVEKIKQLEAKIEDRAEWSRSLADVGDVLRGQLAEARREADEQIKSRTADLDRSQRDCAELAEQRDEERTRAEVAEHQVNTQRKTIVAFQAEVKDLRGKLAETRLVVDDLSVTVGPELIRQRDEARRVAEEVLAYLVPDNLTMQAKEREWRDRLKGGEAWNPQDEPST